MLRKSLITLSVAALCATLFIPASAQDTGTNSAANSSDAGIEATRMVPATAAIKKTIDSNKLKPGDSFSITLTAPAQLMHGPKLPSGTELVGNVATDDTNFGGTSKLVLRFTQANLKGGKVVPIKATIVGVYGPEVSNASGTPISPGDQYPNTWTPQTVQIDQVGALSGIDLHSKISSENSGVFVSTRKDNVKLEAGSEIALAIEESGQGSQSISSTTQPTP
jgi:hypothetical protein